MRALAPLSTSSRGAAFSASVAAAVADAVCCRNVVSRLDEAPRIDLERVTAPLPFTELSDGAIRFVLRRRELGARRADAQRELDNSRPRSLHLCLRRLRHGVLRLIGARPLPREGSAHV